MKQWYTRRKADADCYMGEKFHDPEVHDDKCSCEEHDYEWYVIPCYSDYHNCSCVILATTTMCGVMVNVCLRAQSAYPTPSAPLGRPAKSTWAHRDIAKSLGTSVKVALAWTNPCLRIVPEVSALEAVEDLCLMRHLQLNLSKERSFIRLYVFCSSFFPSLETQYIIASIF